MHKWYFDEVYDATLVSPTVALGEGIGRGRQAADRRQPPHGEAELPPKRFDLFTLDGIVNAVGAGAWNRSGDRCAPCRRGRLRRYVLVLALTAAAAVGDSHGPGGMSRTARGAAVQ